MAVIWMPKQFLPEMIARNADLIVNIASAAGLIGVLGMADYWAAKLGVVGFSDALCLEIKKLGYHGVKVSCICSSFIATGMFVGQSRSWSVPGLIRTGLPKKSFKVS
jgi:all-trans-retinol dehydrogenase (NAD+)